MESFTYDFPKFEAKMTLVSECPHSLSGFAGDYHSDLNSFSNFTVLHD